MSEITAWLRGIDLTEQERSEMDEYITSAGFTLKDFEDMTEEWAKEFFARENLPSARIVALFRIRKAIANLKASGIPSSAPNDVQNNRSPSPAPPRMYSSSPPDMDPFAPEQEDVEEPAVELKEQEPPVEEDLEFTAWTSEMLVEWIKEQDEMRSIKKDTLDKIISVFETKKLDGSMLENLMREHEDDFKKISLGGRHKLRKVLKRMHEEKPRKRGFRRFPPVAEEEKDEVPPENPADPQPDVVVTMPQPEPQPHVVSSPPQQPVIQQPVVEPVAQPIAQPIAQPAVDPIQPFAPPIQSPPSAIQPAPIVQPVQQQEQPLGFGSLMNGGIADNGHSNAQPFIPPQLVPQQQPFMQQQPPPPQAYSPPQQAFNAVPPQGMAFGQAAFQPEEKQQHIVPSALTPVLSSATVPSGPRRWYWYNDDGKWYPYESETSDEIDRAYNEDKSMVALTKGGFFSGRPGLYVIKFDKQVKVHQQLNNGTQEQRPVLPSDSDSFRDFAASNDACIAKEPKSGGAPPPPPMAMPQHDHLPNMMGMGLPSLMNQMGGLPGGPGGAGGLGALAMMNQMHGGGGAGGGGNPYLGNFGGGGFPGGGGSGFPPFPGQH